MVGEVLDNTISGLKDLNKATIKSGIEFEGFTKSLIVAADATSEAGKKWTVFSRLVSGSPLWAIQNKFRAYLAILGGFEQRSKENTKRQEEINEKFVEQRKGIKTIQKEYNELGKTLEYLSVRNMTLSQAMESSALKDEEKKLLGIIENTIEYQRVLAATNDERLAAESAMIKMDSQMEKLNKQNKKMTKAAKQAYAFDQKRIDIATKIAEKEAKGKGLSKDDVKAAGKAAGEAEKGAMETDQKALLKSRAKMLNKIIQPNKIRKQLKKGVVGNLKDLRKKASLRQSYDALNEKMNRMRLKIALKGQKFSESVKPVLNMAFKYLVFGIMAFIGFAVLAGFLYTAWGEFKALGIVENIMTFGSLLFEAVGLIFGTITAFLDGGVEEGFAKLNELFLVVLELLVTGLMIIFKMGVGLVFALWAGLFDFIDFLFNGGFDILGPLLMKVAGVLIAALVLKYFIGIGLQLAGIYALPIMIGVVLIAGIYRVAKWLIDKFDYFSEGGVSGGGMAVVGEKGPELVKLPAGARVTSNKDSRKMVSSGGGNTINITINARDTSDAELRRIADKIGNMVNNKINRRTSSGSMG
tara:strand:- start:7141 stop:8889 length:1749 start_codon:yes stop_codon:yes gene_type:complete